jgi:hypothetical protein
VKPKARLICVFVPVAALLAGATGLVCLATGRSDRHGVPAPTASLALPSVDSLEVQLRIPLDPADLSYLDPLLDEFTSRLNEAEGEFVDDWEEEGDEICYYLYGPDQGKLIAEARAAIAKFPLPAGIYAIKTTPGQEDNGAGERVPLSPSTLTRTRS